MEQPAARCAGTVTLPCGPRAAGGGRDERHGGLRGVVVDRHRRRATCPKQRRPCPLGHLLRGRHQDRAEEPQSRTQRTRSSRRGDHPAQHGPGWPGGVTSEGRARGDDLAPRRARRPPCPLPASGGRPSQNDHEGRHHDEPDEDQRQRHHGGPPPVRPRKFRLPVVRSSVLTIPPRARGSKEFRPGRVSTVMKAAPSGSVRREHGHEHVRAWAYDVPALAPAGRGASVGAS
jgi:hypothetical protein